MTSPSIVILTEPANCQLVDSQLLLEAMLQAQQLAREGVPVTDAYCDNPAAAAEFIDAYAKAYPGLELKSTELPSPEQLYSLLASGQLAPLPRSDGANLAGAPLLNPLIVLSLGKPDGLLQALQGIRGMGDRINVIEIAPDTDEHKAPISVATAVAGHAVADMHWSVENASISHQHGEQNVLPAADEANSGPYKLDSVEFNLDYIQAEAGKYENHHGSPVTGIVNGTLVSATGGSGLEPPAHTDAVPTGSASGNSLATPPDPMAPSLAPAPPPPAANASEPAVLLAAGSSQAPERPIDATDATLTPAAQDLEKACAPEFRPDGSVADPHAAAPAEGAPNSQAGQSGADQSRADQSATDQNNADESKAEQNQAEDSPAHHSPADTARASEKTGDTGSTLEAAVPDPQTAGLKDQDSADRKSSFSEPGADVAYAPTGTFTPEHDVPYPLPAAAAPEVDALRGVLHMSLADEVVDLEAILSHHADRIQATETFDPLMLRPLGPNGHEWHDVHGTPPQNMDLGHPDLSGADNHQDKTAIAVHDLEH
jgi:hypothetical protein